MAALWTQEYFGDLYAEIYDKWLVPTERSRTEAKFTKTVLQLKRQDVLLDVAAGYGRHAKLLSKHCAVVAMDNSPLYMQMAKEKQKNPYDCVVGDMRLLPFQSASFDKLILLFSSFGYFDDEGVTDVNLAMLAEYVRVLRPGGQLLLEIPNPAIICEAVEENSHSIMTNGKYEVEEEFALLSDRSVLENRTVFRSHNGGREQHAQYRLKLYEKSVVVGALKQCGCKLLSVYGDYNGAKFVKRDSEIALLHCVKI